MTELHLLAFSRVWLNKKAEEIMRFFTEDCLYQPSIPYGKKQFIGKSELEKAVIQMLEFDETAFAEVHNIRIDGEFGFWEWTYKTWDGTQIWAVMFSDSGEIRFQ